MEGLRKVKGLSVSNIKHLKDSEGKLVVLTWANQESSKNGVLPKPERAKAQANLIRERLDNMVKEGRLVAFPGYQNTGINYGLPESEGANNGA